MFEDLISYTGLDEASAEMFGFTSVTFQRDFGPWKAGDKVASLWFNTEDGIVKEFSDDGSGNVVKQAKFQLTIKE